MKVISVSNHQGESGEITDIDSMGKEQKLYFDLDYPKNNYPLYSNVNVASGWCFHTREPVNAIKLYVNNKFQSEGILKYPRQDVATKFPDQGESSMLSGFHCHFDYSGLSQGENIFDFYITTDYSEEKISRVLVKDAGSAIRKVSDILVDIVGPCNLRCVMCPQSEHQSGARDHIRGVMPVELFNRVVSFLLDKGYMSEFINLYNWGDPLLHPQLGQIIDICRSNNVKAILSTNLSFPEQRVRKLTHHGVELLIVSISGFSDQTYSKNHVGGNFELVRRNLELLRTERGRIKDVVIKYMVFNYNKHELELARAFCEASGFQFGAYAGAIPSVNNFFRYSEEPDYRRKVEEYIAPEHIRLHPSRFCPQESVITINHRAEVELCTVSTWNSGYGTSLFDTDIPGYLDNKVKNEFCRRCLSSGYSYYKHFGIMSPKLLSESLFNSKKEAVYRKNLHED